MRAFESAMRGRDPTIPPDVRILARRRTHGPPAATAVVTTRNSQPTLAACLLSLRSQSVLCEIVVVDNFSADSTLTVSKVHADIVALAGPERSRQRNVGAALGTSAVIAFVDADMVCDPTVMEEAIEALAATPGAVIVPEASFGHGFWARVVAFEKSLYIHCDAMEAPRIFTRPIFQAAGGYDEVAPPGGEDWDLARRIRRLGPVGRVTARIYHDEGSPTLYSLCRRKAYYARGLRYFGIHRRATEGSRVTRSYIRRPWLAFSRGPVLAGGLVLLKTAEALAVVAALVSRRAPSTDEVYAPIRQRRPG